jgi:hypothetical protein
VYQAADVNDTNGTLNLLGASVAYAAGKNKIINGDFEVWQRGTSFTVPASLTYTSDRFLANRNGTGATVTVSRQTFTPGAAPVSGYEGEFFFRYNQSVAGTTASFSNFSTRVEDVRTLAGQTATLSFWAKADSSRSIPVGIGQNFGSGGSGGVYPATTSVSMTTAWQRFTVTVAVPSVSGKTIGTGSYVDVYWEMPLNATSTIDIWGVQLESGSTATAFQTATGTIQGELAACQRYYTKSYDIGTAPATNSTVQGLIFAITGNVLVNAYFAATRFPVSMRVAPTVTVYSFTSSSTSRVSDIFGTDLAASSGVPTSPSNNGFSVVNSSGGTITAGLGGFIFHYQASAEL